MREAIKVAAIAIGVVAILWIVNRSSGDPGPADIAWKTSLADASAERPRLLYFTADWCGPCQTMKRETWPDDTVEEAIKAFDAVYVNIDDHEDLARQYAVATIPTIVVIDANGEVVDSIQYSTASQMVSFLRANS
ncbi:MAG: thioredoxin family protein [Planctomycetota bacterium]